MQQTVVHLDSQLAKRTEQVAVEYWALNNTSSSSTRIREHHRRRG